MVKVLISHLPYYFFKLDTHTLMSFPQEIENGIRVEESFDELS